MDNIAERLSALKVSHPNNIAVQSFDYDYFSNLGPEHQDRLLKCIHSGIENPDSEMGCYACQPKDYDDFKPFFSKVLASYHKVDKNTRHSSNWNLDGASGLPADGQLDFAKLGLPELSMRIRVGRNLQDFPLPGSMNQQQRVQLESRMLKAIQTLIDNPAYGGHYYSLTPGSKHFIDNRRYQALVNNHIMFKSMDSDRYLLSAGIAGNWPHGRGCYVSGNREIIIWVGEEDHLRIISVAKGTSINPVFNRLKTALDIVESMEGLEFAYSQDYGAVSSCPTNLGTAMRASVHVPLPNLTSDGTTTTLKAIAGPLGLSVRGTGGEHTPIGIDGTVDISPTARFCITEADIITLLYNGLALLQAAETKASNTA